jgi:hypothetical protein
MPLMLRDLDNTLVDRAAVFRRWAVSFAAGFGGGTAEADWLVAADPDGLESRERLALMISRRLGLDGARKEGWWRNCAGDGRQHRGGPWRCPRRRARGRVDLGGRHPRHTPQPVRLAAALGESQGR